MSPKQQRGAPPPPDKRAGRLVEEDESSADDAVEPIGEVVERPDGYHWVSADGRNEFGPFATRAEAQSDMEGFAGGRSELQEAEDAIGLNEWDDDLDGVGELPGGIDDE